MNENESITNVMNENQKTANMNTNITNKTIMSEDTIKVINENENATNFMTVKTL